MKVVSRPLIEVVMMGTTAPAILLVDDDPAVLAAHRRNLRQFAIHTAESGHEALALVATGRRFAVVVADMHMPGLSGLALLVRIRESSPDTVRIMLTGDGDLQTAVDAINEGHIFRFLTKPCAAGALAQALDAALEQHRLLTAEREVLEQTLSGAVRVLTEVLSIVHPVAFSQTLAIRARVRQIAQMFHLENAWQYEVAAMLSQIGCVSLPSRLLEAVYAGAELSEEDQQLYGLHPSMAHDLLANIPRLERIALMIARQLHPAPMQGTRLEQRDPVEIGAALLYSAIETERLVARGQSEPAALRQPALEVNG